MARGEESFLRTQGRSETVLIVSADSLLRIGKKEDLSKAFTGLALKAGAVLACRVSPKQKADIVRLVRRSLPEKTTLAIGDGANDVNMINAAHVGIGISGLEGQQAARAADYAVGEFRFLRPLMFVHGREAFRRNTFLVPFVIFKNSLVVLPLFFFGAESAFSGMMFYDEWMYQMVNIFFTALPVMWFAIFDFERTKEKQIANPAYYSEYAQKSFGKREFLNWMAYTIFYSLLCHFVVFLAVEGSLYEDG